MVRDIVTAFIGLEQPLKINRVFGFVIIVSRFKHITGSKERYLLGQDTTCEFSG